MGVFVGLDVSLSKTAVCVVDRDGAVLWQGKVASEPGPLIARLAEWSGSIDLAGIEACPLSEWLHRGLREAGTPVVCIEVRHAQRFLSAYGPIAQHFRPRRHLLSAAEYRQEMHNRFESWAEITGTKRAA